MLGKVKNDSRSKTERIEVRLSADLKQAIEEYSERNLESIMETTNRAIKAFVGFGQDKPGIPDITEEDDLPKKGRLEIRLHTQLKKMILDLQKKIKVTKNPKQLSISTIVLSAIMQYIGYNVKGK